MKNQVDYFERCIRILKELKEDHPDIELSKHYYLAVDGQWYAMSDKDLYEALQTYKSELDMNTLSDKDLQRVIEDTEELFQEIDLDDDNPDDDWDNERF